MFCPFCQKNNLPGGVRCAYCGALISAPPTDSPPPQSTSPTTTPSLLQRRRGGIVGLLAVLVIKLKSFLALLKFGKVLVTLTSMLLFIAADARLFGWKFGVGIGLCILIHELGHVFVNWRKGLKQSAPVFIPFVGAVIFLKKFPEDPTIQSESGAGGPAAGMLAALFCLLIGWLTHSPFWLVLANVGFLINLFNLIPFPPLDGSHIFTVFSPGLWKGVLIIILLWALKMPSPYLWMILIVGFFRRTSEAVNARYLLAPSLVRLRMAAIFLVLCLGMSYAASLTLQTRQAYFHAGHQPVATTASAMASASRPNPVLLTPEQKSAIRHFVQGALFAFTLLCWLPIPFLIAKAANMRWQPPSLVPAFGAIAVLPLLLFGVPHIAPLHSIALPLLLAYLLGSLFAFVCALRATFSHSRTPKTVWTLTANTALWATAGALLVAYLFNSLLLGFIVLIPVALLLVRAPWLISQWIALCFANAGDYGRAHAWFSKALAQTPPRADEAFLHRRLARIYLALEQGETTLKRLQQADSLASLQDEVNMSYYIHALILQERYLEALDLCESFLLPTKPLSRAVLVRRYADVQYVLIDSALQRGWYDDALARSNHCLHEYKNASSLITSFFLLHKAEALLGLGRYEEAEETLKAIRTLPQTPTHLAHKLCLGARIAAQKHDRATMLQALHRMQTLLPESLRVRYWVGRLQCETNPNSTDKTALEALAHDFPQEYWGRRALDTLQGKPEPAPPPSTPPPTAPAFDFVT